MMFGMRLTGAAAVKGRLARGLVWGTVGCAEVVQHYGDVLVTATKRHSSGRPGPNVITDEYRSGIHKFSNGPFEAGATTDAVQGPRLELGYVGTDSIGRSVNAPAYPHFAPAKDEVWPQFVVAMIAAAKAAT